MADICGITDALAEVQYEILKRINNKFEALRRLMQLLEQLGDLSILIPNLSQLIPVIDIDFDLYTNLRAACPFLNLPPVDETNLENLRNQVISAYSALTRGILNHPWMRMGRLQDELSKYQQDVNSAFASGSQYIQCLQAACRTAKAAGEFFQRVSDTQITAEFTRFGRNFVEQGGQVLTNAASAKYQQALNVVTQMRTLGADVGNDYAAAKALATSGAVTTTAPSALSSTPSTTLTPNPVVTLPSATPIIVPPVP